MKRIYIITLLLACCSLFSHAQQSFFDKYAEMDDVSSVYISKSMINLFSNVDGKINGVNIGKIASRLDCIQIISCEKPNIIAQLRKETADINVKNGYEELIRIREDGDKTTIYYKRIREDGDKTTIYYKKKKKDKKEFILLTDEGNEFTLISITGDLTLEDIQGMIRQE